MGAMIVVQYGWRILRYALGALALSGPAVISSPVVTSNAAEEFSPKVTFSKASVGAIEESLRVNSSIPESYTPLPLVRPSTEEEFVRLQESATQWYDSDLATFSTSDDATRKEGADAALSPEG